MTDTPLHHPADGPPPRTGEDLKPKRAIPRQGTSAVAYSADLPDADDPLLAFTPVPYSRPRRNSITPEVQREHKEELRRRANDPEQTRKLRQSIDTKVANWRREWEERWDAKRALEGGDCASSATNFYYGPDRCLYPR